MPNYGEPKLSKPDDDVQETIANGVMCGDMLRQIGWGVGEIMGQEYGGDYIRTPVNQFLNGERDIDFKVAAGHDQAGRTILAWVVSRNEQMGWAVIDTSEEFDPKDSKPGLCKLVAGKPEDILSPDLLQRSVTRYGGATT